MKNIPNPWLGNHLDRMRDGCLGAGCFFESSSVGRGIVDASKRSPWVVTRFLAYFIVFLTCELAGLSALWWLDCDPGWRPERPLSV